MNFEQFENIIGLSVGCIVVIIFLILTGQSCERKDKAECFRTTQREECFK
jgi:hypothetical protein